MFQDEDGVYWIEPIAVGAAGLIALF